MQPIDPDDPRKPNVQIAASIRAAILSGELQPGQRLSSVEELAKHFGAARMTVHSALRTLRDEGFVWTKTGSGTYVQDQAAMPVAEGETHPLTGTAAFLFEMGYLKNLPRAGWLRIGNRSPESIADHSFRVGILGMVVASLEGADPNRTAALAVFHDAHETRIGDVPAVGRAYITTAKPEAITVHQTSGLPDDMGKLFQDLTGEYEARETPESRAARDADKLETLLQAIEYGEQGYKTEAWVKTSLEALRTESAKQLAQAILTADPAAWWAAFAASYHELRASSKGRSSSGTD